MALWPLTATTEQDAGLAPTVTVAAGTDVDRHRDRPGNDPQGLGVVLVRLRLVHPNLRALPRLARIFWDAAAASAIAQHPPALPWDGLDRVKPPVMCALALYRAMSSLAWAPGAPLFKARAVAVPSTEISNVASKLLPPPQPSNGDRAVGDAAHRPVQRPVPVEVQLVTSMLRAIQPDTNPTVGSRSAPPASPGPWSQPCAMPYGC